MILPIDLLRDLPQLCYHLFQIQKRSWKTNRLCFYFCFLTELWSARQRKFYHLNKRENSRVNFHCDGMLLPIQISILNYLPQKYHWVSQRVTEKHSATSDYVFELWHSLKDACQVCERCCYYRSCLCERAFLFAAFCDFSINIWLLSFSFGWC